MTAREQVAAALWAVARGPYARVSMAPAWAEAAPETRESHLRMADTCLAVVAEWLTGQPNVELAWRTLRERGVGIVDDLRQVFPDDAKAALGAVAGRLKGC